MADAFRVEPDLGFIKEVSRLGGQDLKKCFQCATCSVVCPISPDTRPFPRKEMIATGWGLKDRVVNNSDIWLCHNCGDCTTRCPRGAAPGEVMAAVRAYAVSEYVGVGPLKKLARKVNDPKMLPVLLAIPAVIFLVLGFISNLVGLDWLNLFPRGDEIWQGRFINNYLVDIIMVPTFTFSIAVFALGLKHFVTDMHANALAEGKTDKKNLDPVGIVTGIVRMIPTIARHSKFDECTENSDRSTAHMMVLFSFIGLFIVTGCFFLAEWVFHIEGPYGQINPVKWIGNVSGVALITGSILLLKNRLTRKDQMSTYKDWYLVGLVLALGLTGMLTEMSRLGGVAFLSYSIYFMHLIFVWSLFAYTPYSKLAHLVYRTVALGYSEWSGRK
ncbi:quinone-interacting membrane-bound oxidoreductase complex subunit QmoC [Thermodesulfobacteriota bacterium]